MGREGQEERDGKERGGGETQREGKSLYPTSRSPAPDAATGSHNDGIKSVVGTNYHGIQLFQVGY